MNLHDLDAERAVLGACLVSRQALTNVLPILEPIDFYSETNRKIYSAIRSAAQDHEDLDGLIVGRYSDEATRERVFALIESVPTASNASEYARVVKDASRARALLDALDRGKQGLLEGHENVSERLLAEIQAVTQDSYDEGAKPIADAADELARLIVARREKKGVTGIRSGIASMDNALHGFNSGCSYIIAARPMTGKSLVMQQIASCAAYQNYRVLIQTPEMSAAQYLDRMAHNAAGVDYEKALAGLLTDEEEKKVLWWARKFRDFPIFCDDAGTQTASRVRANVMRFRPDILIIDYLQYMTPDDTRANRNQQVGQVSRDLTRIKSDFHIPVILAAQLSRDIKNRADKRPELWDLRDSGEIEQDADAVVFLHREGLYDLDTPDDEIEFLCRKFRMGSLWYEKLYLAPGANWVVEHRGQKAGAA